jgi:hypothetical protein
MKVIKCIITPFINYIENFTYFDNYMIIRAILYIFLLFFVVSACGLHQNSSLKFRRTGHSIPEEMQAHEQVPLSNKDIAMATSDQQMAEKLLSDEGSGEQRLPILNIHTDTQAMLVQQSYAAKKDTLKNGDRHYKHRNEIVLAKKGPGYVFLFFLTIIPPFIIFLGIPTLLYGIFVYDPRTPLFRAKKYEWAFRYYKVLYILNCIGALAIVIAGIVAGLSMDYFGIILAALIPLFLLGLLAIRMSSKMKKKAVELEASLEEPDATKRKEEFTKTLFHLKMLRWIGMIGIVFPFLPLILIMEFLYLGIHRDKPL